MVIAQTVVVSLKQPADSTAVLPGEADVHREWLFGDELRELGSLGGSCDSWMPGGSEVPRAEPLASRFDT